MQINIDTEKNLARITNIYLGEKASATLCLKTLRVLKAKNFTGEQLSQLEKRLTTPLVSLKRDVFNRR